MKRRIFAIVLSCLMVLSLVPVVALAEEAECEHEYVETVLQAPTCEKEGVKKVTCKNCDFKSYEKIDAHLLDEGTVIEAATCGKAGKVKYNCTACDYTVTKVAPATGEHDYQDGVINATCTEPAKAGSICTVCKAVEPETTLEYVKDSEALGHDWVLDKTAEDYVGAECEKGGVDTFKCSRCDETKKEETEATDHDWDAGVLKNATCEYAQHVLYTCNVCGETKVEETGLDGSAALGHKWADEKVVAPTCDKDGYTLQRCENCNATQEVLPVEANGHATYEKIVAPTCSAKGYTLTLCENCDLSEKVEGSETDIDPEAHKAAKGKVLREATCDSQGVAKSVCEYCDVTLGFMALEADHVWDAGVVVTPNTCDKDGEMLYTCTVCKEATKTEVILAGHDEQYVVIVAGNCGKDGKLGVTCSRCDYAEERVITASGDHKFVEKVVAATCTSPAMAGVACEVCDTPDGDLKVVEGSKALGHDLTDTYVAATCTAADGVKTTCSRCDYVSYEEIGYNKALGHDMVKGETVAPNCTEEGYTLYACSRCDATEKRDVKAALEHDYKENVVAPTCSATGYTEMICKNKGCGDTYVVEGSETEIDPDAHTKAQSGVLLEKTCTTQGVAKMACKDCGIGLGYEAIPAGHKWAEDKANTVPATCEKDGVKAYACSICGVAPTEEEIAAEKLETVIPAAHEWDKGTVTTKETCGKAGVKTFACANCDETYTEEIKATGKHKHEEVIIPASCEDVSYVASKCSVCGDVASKTAVVGSVALGHNYTETLLSADCTNAQRVEYVCTRCDHTYTEDTKIPGSGAIGHKWDDGVIFAPECGVEGYTLYTCATCGETEKRNTVDALEHSYKAETTPATCAAEGKIEMICELCGVIDEDAEVEVLPINPYNHTPVEASVLQAATCTEYGVAKMACKDCGAGCGYQAIDPAHKYNDGKITTPATCLKDGVKTFTCTVCGDSYTEAVAASHKYNDGVITTPATCGKAGVKTYTCSVCPAATEGHSYTEEIPATGEHVFVETIINATCTSPALAGMACSVCGEAETEMDIVTGSEALGHDFKDELLSADCTNGQRVHTTCSRCDYDVTEETGLEDALGHNISRFLDAANGSHRGLCTTCKKIVTENCTVGETETIPANCQNGTRVVYDCTVCGKNNELSNDGVKVPTNHNYGIEKVLVAATCDAPGISKFTCECDKDGKIYIYKTTEKAHTWGEDLVNEDATAVYHVCSVCGEVEFLEVFEGYVCDEHPSKYVENYELVKADCYNTGLTAGKYCTLCDTWIVKQVVIPVTHDYKYVGDDHNEAGEYVMNYKCAECGKEIEVIH